jgi:hypothetical protein
VIALVQIALPSEFLILAEEKLDLLTYEPDQTVEGLGEVEVRLLPPYCSGRPTGARPGAFGADPNAMNPADPQPVDPTALIDGRPAVRCDTIAVNIVAADFDRRRDRSNETTANLVRLACDAVNGALQRLRVMARVPHLKPLDPQNVVFRLAFSMTT